MVAIFGFQFGLYHVVVPLSFLRSISLALLFANVLESVKSSTGAFFAQKENLTKAFAIYVRFISFLYLLNILNGKK